MKSSLVSVDYALATTRQPAMIREIMLYEPDVPEILLQVARLPPNPAMNRWQVYEDLKKLFIPLVGTRAKRAEIATEEHYTAFLDFLDALVPEEQIEGEEEE